MDQSEDSFSPNGSWEGSFPTVGADVSAAESPTTSEDDVQLALALSLSEMSPAQTAQPVGQDGKRPDRPDSAAILSTNPELRQTSDPEDTCLAQGGHPIDQNVNDERSIFLGDLGLGSVDPIAGSDSGASSVDGVTSTDHAANEGDSPKIEDVDLGENFWDQLRQTKRPRRSISSPFDAADGHEDNAQDPPLALEDKALWKLTQSYDPRRYRKRPAKVKASDLAKLKWARRYLFSILCGSSEAGSHQAIDSSTSFDLASFKNVISKYHLSITDDEAEWMMLLWSTPCGRHPDDKEANLCYQCTCERLFDQEEADYAQRNELPKPPSIAQSSKDLRCSWKQFIRIFDQCNLRVTPDGKVW